MPFHPPPAHDERDGLAGFLAQAQDGVRALAHGLTDEQAHRAPSASEISVGWLLRHLTVVQQNWLEGAMAAPEPLTDDQNAVIMARSHDLDGGETVAGLLADFDAVAAELLEAVRTLDPDTPLPVPDAPWFPRDITHWSVRWVWLHLLQEVSRHLGHGDVVRETVDGATAFELVAAHDGHTEPVFGFLEPWRPPEPSFTRGVSTVVLSAQDVAAARDWYADLFGLAAYFDTPAYAEFRVGPHEHEIGILDRRYAGAGWTEEPDDVARGVVVHLWVDDADAALAHLVAHGAREHQPARHFSDPATGYRGGSVVDPFGNVLGVITRPG